MTSKLSGLALLSVCVALMVSCTANPVGASPTPTTKPTGTVVRTGVGCGPAQPAPSVQGPTRVPTAPMAAYDAIAADGSGTAWLASTGGFIDCYRSGQPIKEFALAPHALPIIMRSAPDGSIWFADLGRKRLGRIGLDGVLSEMQVGGTAGLAIGPDGSVWFHTGNTIYGVARILPDGRMTTYPVGVWATITVDSKGNAWMPGAYEDGRAVVVRISNSGEVTRFLLPQSVRQLAEAPDGHLWFLNVSCTSTGQIGWIDANGVTKYFDAPIADDTTYPNAIVRAPDGALWFSTSDRRLVRLVSETDVTIYSLPWSDAVPGQFVVLPGNHIVMYNNTELLDFVAANGTRLAGAGAIPANAASDTAEGTAYAAAEAAWGGNKRLNLSRSWEGDHAALFAYSSPCSLPDLYVYVVDTPDGWRKYDAYTSLDDPYLPSPGTSLQLILRTGCLNVHESPQLSSRILACLPSGSSIGIDQLPVYANGYIWWHLIAGGWGVQLILLCNKFLYASLAQC